MTSTNSSAAAIAASIAETLDGDLLTELIDALSAVPDTRQAKRVVERRTSGSIRVEFLDLLESAPYESALPALDAANRAARGVRSRLGEATLVWTGPTVRTMVVRPTLQVVQELVRQARISLTVVTYASYDVQELVETIDTARRERGVEVRLLLETEEDSGGRLKGDAATAFGNLVKAVPVYRWPLANRGTTGGSMHVKTVIKDRQAMLVSSANLTSAAMDRNMELGVLIEGGDLPRIVDCHFDELIEAEHLHRIEV